MHQEHTPPALQDTVQKWTHLARDDADPFVRAAARELVADLKHLARPREQTAQRPPAYWRRVIGAVIDVEPRYSETEAGYKTGHGHAHASKSGTCLSVDTRRGLWYCSSCRRGGTAVSWVMDIEQCSYGQAWEMLASRFGAANANADTD